MIHLASREFSNTRFTLQTSTLESKTCRTTISSNNNNDRERVNSMALRPAPPHRPCTPSRPTSELNTKEAYKGDAQILQVIEAYFVSPKSNANTGKSQSYLFRTPK